VGSYFILSPEWKWKHEQGSEMMFDYMVETYSIPIREKDVLFIKALIAGNPQQCEWVTPSLVVDQDLSQCSPSEKRFLFDIIANKRNGLDVDKYVGYISLVDSMLTCV